MLPRLALDGGITRGVDLEIIPLRQPVSRQITLIWRQNALRRDEYRALGEFMLSCVQPAA